MKPRNNVIICAALMGLFACILGGIISWELGIVSGDWNTLEEIRSSKTITATEYIGMTKTVEGNKEKMDSQLARQFESITELERSMELYVKESVLSSIAHTCLDCNTSFDNFYVTKEGSIKSDYSVQIRGKFSDIVMFVDKLCKDNAGISVGEFSLRQDYSHLTYLTRFFDKSNALIWYNGDVGGLPTKSDIDAAEQQSKEYSADQLNNKISSLYNDLTVLEEELERSIVELGGYKNQYQSSGDLIVSPDGETLRYRISAKEKYIQDLRQTIYEKEAELVKLETKETFLNYTKVLPTSDKIKYVLTITFRV